ncbi:MAG: sigma-54 dependent transcriptional regulator [Desulfobacterales bacterium]
MKPKILVVDDDASHRLMLDAVLTAEKFEVSQADSGQSAIAAVEEQFFDLILMDVRMSRIGGIEALKKIRKISPAIPVIIMTAYSSVSTAVEALKSGASDYLTKPLDIEELKILLHKTMQHQKLEQENIYLKERVGERFDFSNIIGRSSAMKKLFETVSLVAPTEATVLITGESGTGKELIANAIHENSRRKEKLLITVNCAALPETLLESELFGHEKGAFTGATERQPGRFRAADTGTIFLDEITEMSSATQPKILRVLQEGEINPLGSSKTVKVDTRILAATNRNLSLEMEKGTFREDLFYRLNVVNICVPPLRERRDDIPLLTDFFLKQYVEKNQKLIKGLTPRAMDLLMRYNWPGNVRELENMIERAVILTRSDMISEKDLPEPIHLSENHADTMEFHFAAGKSLKEVEKEMIIRTLENNDGNRTRSAEVLGISRRTLQIKLKEYGIN